MVENNKIRLIDANKIGLTDFEIIMCNGDYKEGLEMILQKIENAPTIDAVPVVRCKDCKFGREACGNIECSADFNVPSEYHSYNWFCPNGKRKDDNKNDY